MPPAPPAGPPGAPLKHPGHTGKAIDFMDLAATPHAAVHQAPTINHIVELKDPWYSLLARGSTTCFIVARKNLQSGDGITLSLAGSSTRKYEGLIITSVDIGTFEALSRLTAPQLVLPSATKSADVMKALVKSYPKIDLSSLALVQVSLLRDPSVMLNKIGIGEEPAADFFAGQRHNERLSSGSSGSYSTVYTFSKYTASPPSFFHLPHRVRSVACGKSHTLIATTNGQLFGSGKNEFGEVGILNSEGVIASLTKINALPPEESVARVACGDNFSACVTVAGSVYMWGRNDLGQCGVCANDGNESNEVNEPSQPSQRQQESPKRKNACIRTPTRLTSFASDISFVYVACGPTFAACLCSFGRLYMWGTGAPLGNAHINPPQRVDTLLHVAVTSIALGSDHAIAICQDYQVFAWGKNDYGQLGIGDRAPRTKPTAIPSLVSKRPLRIAAGAQHTILSTCLGHVYVAGAAWPFQAALPSSQLYDRLVFSLIPCLSGMCPAFVTAGNHHSLVCNYSTALSKVIPVSLLGSKDASNLIQLRGRYEGYSARLTRGQALPGEQAIYLGSCVSAQSLHGNHVVDCCSAYDTSIVVTESRVRSQAISQRLLSGEMAFAKLVRLLFRTVLNAILKQQQVLNAAATSAFRALVQALTQLWKSSIDLIRDMTAEYHGPNPNSIKKIMRAFRGESLYQGYLVFANALCNAVATCACWEQPLDKLVLQLFSKRIGTPLITRHPFFWTLLQPLKRVCEYIAFFEDAGHLFPTNSVTDQLAKWSALAQELKAKLNAAYASAVFFREKLSSSMLATRLKPHRRVVCSSIECPVACKYGLSDSSLVILFNDILYARSALEFYKSEYRLDMLWLVDPEPAASSDHAGTDVPQKAPENTFTIVAYEKHSAKMVKRVFTAPSNHTARYWVANIKSAQCKLFVLPLNPTSFPGPQRASLDRSFLVEGEPSREPITSIAADDAPTAAPNGGGEQRHVRNSPSTSSLSAEESGAEQDDSDGDGDDEDDAANVSGVEDLNESRSDDSEHVPLPEPSSKPGLAKALRPSSFRTQPVKHYQPFVTAWESVPARPRTKTLSSKAMAFLMHSKGDRQLQQQQQQGHQDEHGRSSATSSVSTVTSQRDLSEKKRQMFSSVSSTEPSDGGFTVIQARDVPHMSSFEPLTSSPRPRRRSSLTLDPADILAREDSLESSHFHGSKSEFHVSALPAPVLSQASRAPFTARDLTTTRSAVGISSLPAEITTAPQQPAEGNAADMLPTAATVWQFSKAMLQPIHIPAPVQLGTQHHHALNKRVCRFTFDDHPLYHRCTYDGVWCEGRPEGLGTLETQEGCTYSGSFKNGCCDGYAYAEFPKAHPMHVVSGMWKEGAINGHACVLFRNADKHVGEWRAGLQHGFGACTYANGTEYKGEWVAGERSGYGLLTSHEARAYGRWKKGKLSGHGIVATADFVCEALFAHGQVMDVGSLYSSANAAITSYHGRMMSDFQYSDFSQRLATPLLAGDGILLQENVVVEGVFHGEWAPRKNQAKSAIIRLVDGPLFSFKTDAINFSLGRAVSQHAAHTPYARSQQQPQYSRRLVSLFSATRKVPEESAHRKWAAMYPRQRWQSLFDRCMAEHKALKRALENPAAHALRLGGDLSESSMLLDLGNRILKLRGQEPSVVTDEIPALPHQIVEYVIERFEDSHHPLGRLIEDFVDCFSSCYPVGQINAIEATFMVLEINEILCELRHLVESLFSDAGTSASWLEEYWQRHEEQACPSHRNIGEHQFTFSVLQPVVLRRVYPTVFAGIRLHAKDCDEALASKLKMLWALPFSTLMTLLEIAPELWYFHEEANQQGGGKDDMAGQQSAKRNLASGRSRMDASAILLRDLTLRVSQGDAAEDAEDVNGREGFLRKEEGQLGLPTTASPTATIVAHHLFPKKDDDAAVEDEDENDDDNEEEDGNDAADLVFYSAKHSGSSTPTATPNTATPHVADANEIATQVANNSSTASASHRERLLSVESIKLFQQDANKKRRPKKREKNPPKTASSVSSTSHGDKGRNAHTSLLQEAIAVEAGTMEDDPRQTPFHVMGRIHDELLSPSLSSSVTSAGTTPRLSASRTSSRSGAEQPLIENVSFSAEVAKRLHQLKEGPAADKQLLDFSQGSSPLPIPVIHLGAISEDDTESSSPSQDIWEQEPRAPMSRGFLEAVAELKRLPSLMSCVEKVNCLERTRYLIEQTIIAFKNGPVGADELMPSLCFVLVKARVPNLLGHIVFIQHFVPRSMLEPTHIITAVEYLTSHLKSF